MGFWSAGERFFRSPSATLGRHQTLAISPFFAVRSLLLHCTARETDGGITDRVIDAFAPFEGLALRHIEDDRSSCSIGVLAAFDGLCDDGAPGWPMAIGKRSPALQEPIFGVFGAPNFTNTPKKQKVIGKKIISGLLTVLRRPVYASGHYECP